MLGADVDSTVAKTEAAVDEPANSKASPDKPANSNMAADEPAGSNVAAHMSASHDKSIDASEKLTCCCRH
jgi:hypothetical protein